jgi:hypothetical protein
MSCVENTQQDFAAEDQVKPDTLIELQRAGLQLAAAQ